MVVGDMPFMSYNVSVQQAIENCGRMLKEGGCDVVKLEGGTDFAPTIEAIVKAGIPVQGHIGLTPQTASALGGFKTQGRDAMAAKKIVDDAKALEDSLKKGATAYIFKPLSPTPLYRLVQKVTEKKPRENVRARIIFKVAVLYQNQRRVSFASMLSEAGVFIRTVKPIPVGTKVSLSMDLPSEKPIELEGVVIYIVEFNKEKFIEPGMCIHFTNIDKNIQLGLRKFVEEQLTHDIDPNLEL